MQAEWRSADRANAGFVLMVSCNAGAGQQTYMRWERACIPLSLAASPSMPPQCSSYSRWCSMSPCASPLNPRSHTSSGICSSGCWQRFVSNPLLFALLSVCLSVCLCSPACLCIGISDFLSFQRLTVIASAKHAAVNSSQNQAHHALWQVAADFPLERMPAQTS